MIMMKRAKFVAVALIAIFVIYIGATWSASHTRGVQNFLGITDGSVQFAQVSLSIPPVWVFFYSKGTERWVDNKLYGFLPSDKFDDHSGALVLFLVGDREEDVVGFYQMEQSSVDRWERFLLEDRCGALMSRDPGVLSCDLAYLGGYDGVRVIATGSAAYYLPTASLVIAAPREELLNYVAELVQFHQRNANMATGAH